MVRLDSAFRRDHTFHRLVSVGRCLLRRRRLGNHEVDQRRRELDRSGLRRFRLESISCFTIDECTAVGGIGIVETTDGVNLDCLRLRRTGTELPVSVSCPNALTCVAVGVSTGNPSIVGTDNGTTWTQLRPAHRQSLDSRVLLRHRPTCVAVGVASGGGATSPQHRRTSRLGQRRTSIPFGIAAQSQSHARIETTCIAVGTNLSSTPYVVGTSNNGSTWSLQTPPTNAVDLTGISCSAAEDCIAVGNTGNLGAGSTIMGTTTGGLSVDGTDPATGNESLELGVVPDHRRLLRRRSRTRFWRRSTRDMPGPHSRFPPASMASTAFRASTTSDCTAVGFGIFGSPVIIGTVNAGATWTSESVPVRSRHLDGSLVLQALPYVSRRERLRQLLAQHHRDGQRRRNVDDRRRYPGIVTNFTRHLVPGLPALHRRRAVVGWTERSHPRHDGRRNDLGPADSSRCCDRSQRASRVRATRPALATGPHVIGTTDGGSQWNDLGTPGGSTTLESVSCISIIDLHRRRRHQHPRTTDGGATWTSRIGSVRCRVPVSGWRAPVRSTAKPSERGRTLGGIIATLSAPPSVTTTSLTIGTIGVPYSASLAASGGLAPYSWAVVGREPAARPPSGSERRSRAARRRSRGSTTSPSP